MNIKGKDQLPRFNTMLPSSYARLHLVRFEPFNRSVAVSSGTTLLDAAQHAGIGLPSACRGQGDCCECDIDIKDGIVSGRTDLEESCIEAGCLSEERRLACCTRILGSVLVRIPDGSAFKV